MASIPHPGGVEARVTVSRPTCGWFTPVHGSELGFNSPNLAPTAVRGLMQRGSFVILDRDGTIIVERDYPSEPCQVELLPCAAVALKHMRTLGLGLVLVSNQSGVGRGYFPETRLQEVHHRLEQLLASEGVALDGYYYCPHRPEDACRCRKPEPGLVERAARDLGVDPCSSFVVGDNAVDVELGRRLGAPTVLVRTGYGAQVERDGVTVPDFVVDDLKEAASLMERLLTGPAGSQDGGASRPGG